ncbi:alcohol dehydrogenase catalytic domain-containing protein [Streptomyces sp. LBUM 1476]|nr:alcohol dehydrogenase catalytic domain-containing protein [Streptomyces sp. LBUM 1476]
MTPSTSGPSSGTPGRPSGAAPSEARAPGSGEVRIDVQATGICGADIGTFRDPAPTTGFPVTPGHEVAGVVAELGPDVAGWAVGERVTVGWFGGSCGHDHRSRCHPRPDSRGGSRPSRSGGGGEAGARRGAGRAALHRRRAAAARGRARRVGWRAADPVHGRRHEAPCGTGRRPRPAWAAHRRRLRRDAAPTAAGEAGDGGADGRRASDGESGRYGTGDAVRCHDRGAAGGGDGCAGGGEGAVPGA